MALDEYLGAIELGGLVSTVLFGVMIVQCYTYSQADHKDIWPVKTLVGNILCHLLYYYSNAQWQVVLVLWVQVVSCFIGALLTKIDSDCLRPSIWQFFGHTCIS